MADFTIIKNEGYQPFNRYIDIGGLRIFGLDEVSDNFLNKVASTYEAMLASNNLINLEMRSAFIDTLKENYIFQRVGFDSPEYYGGGDKLPQHPINGNYKDNQTDYIWEGLSRSEASQISTVIEHLLHTITGVGFAIQFSEWDPQNPSSKINLAMEQAIEGGYYDVSSYESIKLRGDDAGYAKAIVIEFSYWLILAEWEYFEITDKANNNIEFTLRTASDIASKLPLAHELYLDTAATILSRPDETVIRSLFSKESGDNDSNLSDAENTLTKEQTIDKETEIISQNSSQSVLKVHEHQYGQTLLDLTFLNIDEGTIEFTTIVQDGTTYSYGNEEQYKRFSVDKDSLRLQEESVFVGRDVSFTYVPDDGDPFTTNAYITSFSFIYKSNGTEKEHTVIIDEIIDDIDRSGSFAENKYTIDIYGKEISKLSDETKTLILDNTEYVIKDLSTKMSWKGTMDFGVNVNTDSNKPTGVVSAIAFNMATNSSGERVHSATHEQETGEDLNGITVDLGMNISLQDSYDPEIGQLTVYSANLWFDPNPNPNSFSNKPSNDGSTDSPLDYFDFISIVYHEVFHSMGIAYDPNNPDNSNRYSDNVLPADSEGNIYYSSDRANAILEGGILLDDELLDHWDLGPPVNGKVVTIMNSAGYYDYSWREPADIDWAVIQDIGWTKKTEGILSKTIDPNKNTLEAFSESSKGGTLNFSSGNNIIVADGQAKTLRGLDGDDTYFISNLLPKDSSIEIIDTSGINTIQIASNTKVIKTLWTQDAARLTFEDDRVITINGADEFTFNLGGNITNGEEGLDVTFSEFAFYFGINDINSISGSETGEVTDLYII